MAWNGSLHPRAAAGTSAGGQFTAGGSRQKPQKQPPPPKNAKPESLKAIAAKRAAGKPLTPQEKHLWHLNHVNVMKRKAAMAAETKAKPKTTPRPKTAAKKAAPKMTSGQKTKAMQMARSGR